MIKELTVFAFVLLLLLEGCSVKPSFDAPVQSVATPEYVAENESFFETEGAHTNHVVPTMCIDGICYYDTGLNSYCNGCCGMMDGTITSECPEDDMTSVSNQSNFGSGFSYQIGHFPGTYEVHVGTGDWRIFACDDVLKAGLNQLLEHEEVRKR